MRSANHQKHITEKCSHSRCPECRADNSRWHAQTRRFSHADVPKAERSKYLKWARPRIEAIRKGESSINAARWHLDFIQALHNRLYSQKAGTGRKFAPDYAKYHLATYGNDWHYLNT